MTTRSEVEDFINETVANNTQRLRFQNRLNNIHHQQYSPHALCNRKNATVIEQQQQMQQKLNDLIQYVAKESVVTR